MRSRSLAPNGSPPSGARWLAPIKPVFHAALRAYLARARPAFVLGDRSYDYFWHDHNMTWRNERCVEVALARAFLAQFAGTRVLEIGNVLSHYIAVSHDVVDKYERAPGVRNEDVVDFVPERPYDLVVSISTLEHVGWNETPREPGKALRAVAHLRERCLAPGGRMLVTFPVGHNRELDQAFASGRLPFMQSYCMKRVGRFAHWREATGAEVRDAVYGHPYPFANAIVIGLATR
jgi:hypothetical protein